MVRRPWDFVLIFMRRVGASALPGIGRRAAAPQTAPVAPTSVTPQRLRAGAHGPSRAAGKVVAEAGDAAPGLLHPSGMWTNLAYRCDACHAYTQVQSRCVHPGT